MDELDSVCSKTHDALARIISDEQAAIVTKWVALVEVIGEDGKRSMWSLTSDELSQWDQVGLVEFHSRTLQPELRRDDE